MVQNPAAAWRKCPLKFYSSWNIYARDGLPVELDEVQGVNDEEAGEPQGYHESSGWGPILMNTVHVKRKRASDLREGIENLKGDLLNLDAQHVQERIVLSEREAEAARKREEEKKNNQDLFEKRRKKQRSEAAKKGHRTRKMHYWEDKVMVSRAARAQQQQN